MKFQNLDTSSLKFKEVLGPGDSYTFQLNIENKANGDDTFTVESSGKRLTNVPKDDLEQIKIHLKCMISNGDLVPLETHVLHH